MAFDLPLDYNDVASRIHDFRTKHPDGSLQQMDLQFIEFGGKSWVVYTAAAFRSPDDPRPGMGTAWEAVPGKTNFTRDSEVQNAETAAWGRAIAAVLAADTKKGVASAEEVRGGQVRADAQTPVDEARNALRAACALHSLDLATVRDEFFAEYAVGPNDASIEQLQAFTKKIIDREAAK